jgi:hypothetical protein
VKAEKLMVNLMHEGKSIAVIAIVEASSSCEPGQAFLARTWVETRARAEVVRCDCDPLGLLGKKGLTIASDDEGLAVISGMPVFVNCVSPPVIFDRSPGPPELSLVCTWSKPE